MAGLLMRFKYVGVDESNHGRYPEIFVACPSNDLLDIEETSDKIGKSRKRKSIQDIVNGKLFYHIVVPELYVDILGGTKELKVVVFTEFISSFSGLEHLLIDGKHGEEIFESVEALLYPDSIPDITTKKDGDQYIPLVNRADKIAYALFKYYCRQGHSWKKSGFRKVLITPKIENYAERMEKLGINFS